MPVCHASKLNSAYEALRIYDYFKAKKQFSQLVKRENAAAAYGLAIIYRRQDNPFHHLDSAVKYGALAKLFFQKAKTSIFTYKNFRVDSNAIATFCDSVARTYLKRIENKNNVEWMEQFLKRQSHCSASIIQSALQLRDELILEKMVRVNHCDTTRQLLLTYPQNYLLNDAQKVYDRQLYAKLTESKTEEAYKNYLKRYPNTSFSSNAQDALFTIYKTNANKQGLAAYVKSYPQAHQTPEAWKLLFALSVKAYSNQELQGFLNDYPDFPFKTSILKEIKLNNYTLLPFEAGDLQGFIDTSSHIAIAPQFDKVNAFSEGVALVTKGDSVFFINKENQNVFNRYYAEAYDFKNGIAAVMLNNQWFFINRQGQQISGFYDDVSELSNDVYVVKQTNKFGTLDKYAQTIVAPRFTKIGDFKNEKAYIEEDGLFGFIDKQGNITRPHYQWISDFNEYGIAIVQLNNQYGLINANNETILEPKFDQLLYAGKNIFIVVKNNLYGYYSGKGCFMSEVNYDFKKEKTAAYYTNGFILRLLKKEQQAFMDGNGRISIDFGVYDEIAFASQGLIKVKRKNKYGFVNRKLNLVIPYKYDQAEDFKDSLAIVKRKSKMYLLSLTGEELMETEGTITYIAKGFYQHQTTEQNELLNASRKIIYGNVKSLNVLPQGYLLIYLKDASVKVLKL